ncbi:MAG: hypothetical protein HOI66_10750 [Verrucomicrobia bacterium]|nr:hypothetical protein [Verrucomicrobiota bacterium]
MQFAQNSSCTRGGASLYSAVFRR